MPSFDLFGVAPLRTPGDTQPDLVLRSRRPNSSGTPMLGEVSLDGLGADDDHRHIE
jgi:hypothetical protein